MTIEVQVKDIEEYNRLKKYAVYSSDRTKVLELPDNCTSLLSNNVDIDESSNVISVDYRNKKWIFENITDELRYYLGDIYGGKPEYKFEIITQIPKLLEQNIISLTDNAKNIFKRNKKIMKFSDLECYNKKFKVNGKWANFEEVKDQELEYIFSDKIIKKKNITTREAEIINSLQSKDKKGKEYLDVSMQVLEQGFPQTVNTKIYYMTRIMHDYSPLFSLMKVGSKINALIEDKSEFGKTENLVFAGVAPFEYKQKEEYIFSPSKNIKNELGKLPVALYRIAFAEYTLRNL